MASTIAILERIHRDTPNPDQTRQRHRFFKRLRKVGCRVLQGEINSSRSLFKPNRLLAAHDRHICQVVIGNHVGMILAVFG